MNKEYTLPELETEDGGLNLWELSQAELAEFEQEFVKEDLSRLRNELDKALENVIKLVETKIPDVNLRITFMSRILKAANAYNQATTITETELHNLGAIYSSFLRKLLPFGA